MNIEAYDLDTLRKLVRDLQAENRSLKEHLTENQIPFESDDVFGRGNQIPDEYDPDQASLIEPISVTDDIARRFYGMFWGRTDVYARRGKNGGYFPQCKNRWINDLCPRQQGKHFDCSECRNQNYEKLELWHIRQHLQGARENCTDVIGVYPLLPDDTCRFLVFDFDNHEKGADKLDNANTDDAWRDEVDALRRICELCGIDALTERSRSGRGAHVWIFFKQPVPASLARRFGFALLDKGCESINLTSFRFYDRVYPSQDSAQSLGNLVALPLQGQALKSGNSAFVDKAWNAYPDQLEALDRIKRLGLADIEVLLTKWETERMDRPVTSAYLHGQERLKPWKRNDAFHAEDVAGTLHIVLADGVYVDALNLSPRLQNQIRCLATIDNPEFYRRKDSGNSTYYYLSTIYLGRDVEGYIQVPRGLFETLTGKCDEAGISYEVEDHRTTGRPIRVSFRGELRMQQDLAAEKLLRFDNGILSAATAFGKTVVCAYLIAQRKVPTLILLESADLVDQWIDELNRFLDIDEEPPTYHTKTGRAKKRKDVIGTYRAGTDKTTGIVDVAMVGSIYRKGEIFPEIDRYGLVIMDECHHAASAQAQQVLRRVKAKYVYGVSATPVRSDKLEKINYMMLGPIRHQYTPKEHALTQGIDLLVRPRFTRVGFDCPRLDTLMLASPVKFDGRLTQYVGRPNRSYEGKHDVVVYDYVDAHIGIFDNQYRNRLSAYKKIGYRIQSDTAAGHQSVNAIYDRGNYTEVFERDLVEAEQEIVVASPGLRRQKVERMISLLKPRQEAGIKVTVITLHPDYVRFGDPVDVQMMIDGLRRAGISVSLTDSESEHFAVIDKKLVWHGGMNLLGKEDAWDNLIRVESVKAAAELLEMTKKQTEPGDLLG